MDVAVPRSPLCSRRTPLVEPLVGPPMVVVLRVPGQYSSKMARVQYHQAIQALIPDRSDPTLGHCIGIRCPVGGQDDLDALGPEHRVEASAELGVPVVDQEADGQKPILEVPAQLPGLLDDPAGSGMLGAAGDMDSAGGQLDEEE